jgi:hypothetical protein
MPENKKQEFFDNVLKLCKMLLYNVFMPMRPAIQFFRTGDGFYGEIKNFPEELVQE